MNRDDRFLKKEYMKNLFPIMFSVLGGTINALIDSVFVSQKLGSDGLAAVNMSMPVYLVICTVGSLIAGGASILSAQFAGEEDMDDAQGVYNTALWFCLIMGLIVTIGGCSFCRPLTAALAQNGELTGYVYAYCLITLIGAIPTTLTYMPLFYLQLEGKTHEISVMMAVMIAVDVILDIVLLFVIPLGIYGAALASVISTFMSCIYGFVMLERGYSNYHIKISGIVLKRIKDIVRLGSPIAIGNFMDAIKLLLLNAIILAAGGTSAAAVWAVLNSLSEFSMTITSGVPQAAGPMTSAYYTARENSGLRILARLQVQVGLLLSVLYGAILFVLHGPIGRLFAIQENLMLPFVCLGVFCVFEVLCSIWVGFFNATGRIAVSNILVIGRKLVFPVGTAVLMLVMNGYLWVFLPLATELALATGVVVTGVVAWRYKGKYPLSRWLLLDDCLELEQKVLDFSIAPDAESICNASEQIKEFCEINEMNMKQVLRLGLAIEELLSVIVQRVEGIPSVDLRAFSMQGVTGIRIRCAGKRYNPFEDESDDDFLMGVEMVQKMAETVSYTYSLGMNVINILI